MLVTKYNLNFVVEDYDNPKMLVLTDLSEYPENADSPIWSVTLPGFDKCIELNAIPNKSTYLNSNLLGFSNNVAACDLLDLPDGIWKITYKICPYDQLYHSVYFFKTAKLQHDFDLLLSNLNIDVNGEITEPYESYETVMVLIESCKACARLGDNKKAMNRYEAALQYLKRLKIKTNG